MAFHNISVLGPLLFILYTNDLPTVLQSAKSILFADDITVYCSSPSIENIYLVMTEELDRLTDWFKANTLSLNIAKTSYMLFTSNAVQPINLHISDQTISRSSNAKFLGV